MHEPVLPEVVALADALRTRGWRLATAESCTGGLIAAACTALAGSSDWFERGVVSYSNAAKTELLGVPAALIAAHGAVSEPVARAMAEGVLARSSAELAIAVTGIAGPGGAVPGKPVGTVWLGWGRPGAIRTECLHLTGDRGAVRQATVVAALARALGQALAEAAPTIPASSVHPGSAPGTMPDDAPDITLNHASNPAPNPAPDRTPGRTA